MSEPPSAPAYPRRVDDARGLVWACCESPFGPPCGHRRDYPDGEVIFDRHGLPFVRYTGGRTASGPKVWREDSAGRRPLRRVARHSPIGFEWGCNDPGTFDLALSLLVDYLRLDAHPDGSLATGPWVAPGGVIVESVPHITYARRVLFGLPRFEAWTLHSDDLDDWLAQGGVTIGRAA